MRKRTRWIVFSVIGLLVVALAVRYITKKETGTLVTAEPVKRRTIVETITASGKLHPETEVRVSAPIGGEVVQLLVREGDTVTKGQVLARIQGDRNGAAAPRVQLPAGVPAGFEGVLQSLQPARSLGPSSATITAPVSGTVLGLSVKQGERVSGELMRIADMRNLEVRVDVNENNIIKVSVGDSADVEVDAYNKRKFKGVVTSIGNGGSGGRRDVQSMMSADLTAYDVHIRLLPASYNDLLDTSQRRRMAFRPGMNARAEIKTGRREGVLSVPVSAVASRAKGDDTKKEEDDKDLPEAADTTAELEEVVFVLKENGTAEKRTVTTGIQDMNAFEIVTGLREGEQVITGPNTALATDLRTGKKVKVVKRKELFKTD